MVAQKQNGDSSLAGVVRMRDVMKSIDTIRQEADKRMRAQQSRQSGQQCGPVELKKEVSFKAQAALSTQHQLPNRAANRKAKWRFLPDWSGHASQCAEVP
ncbi:hypothetical protein AAFF_G00222140 [Aldrovandia affinis]|uniref:Uncharacterized protein n=2 Tax=Aldrovandia affinis TaxID=143900 RepID=A0AAD7R0Q3_9TELE|nr:hypothetical protein AAFF_G00222140 [Aldrovandia affinis]